MLGSGFATNTYTVVYKYKDIDGHLEGKNMKKGMRNKMKKRGNIKKRKRKKMRENLK